MQTSNDYTKSSSGSFVFNFRSRFYRHSDTYIIKTVLTNGRIICHINKLFDWSLFHFTLKRFDDGAIWSHILESEVGHSHFRSGIQISFRERERDRKCILLVIPLVINDLLEGRMLFPFQPDGEKRSDWNLIMFKTGINGGLYIMWVCSVCM